MSFAKITNNYSGTRTLSSYFNELALWCDKYLFKLNDGKILIYICPAASWCRGTC